LSQKIPQEIKKSILSPDNGIYTTSESLKHGEFKYKPATFYSTSYKKICFNKYQVTTSLSNRRNYTTKSNTLPEEFNEMFKIEPKGGTYQTYEQVEKYLKPQGKDGDYDKRQLYYFVVGCGRFIYAAGIRLLVLKFLHSLSVAADLKALSSIEVDIKAVPAGKTITVTWRGKPVFIRHRTTDEISNMETTPMSDLKHPQTDQSRVQDPNWIVCIAVCTHLGCVPVIGQGDFKAFFCPCHGSHYDFSGRIRKGPAPLNLAIPPYKFTENNSIILG